LLKNGLLSTVEVLPVLTDSIEGPPNVGDIRRPVFISKSSIAIRVAIAALLNQHRWLPIRKYGKFKPNNRK
jgi:hypothetical protein